MKKILLGFSVLLFASQLMAQERYQNQITDSVAVTTYTYAKKGGDKLELDMYAPNNDNQSDRAVFLYVHGGGFSGGTKNSPEISAFCNKIAQHGYVAVSINYRLIRKGTQSGFGCDCPVTEKLAAIDTAVYDLRSAVNFLKDNKVRFGIDPQKIILAGSSAGAETVLCEVFNTPKYTIDQAPYKYAGVVGMAGGISDVSKLTAETAIPALFFHGTCDQLVPYGSEPHRYCEKESAGYMIMNGSRTIAEKLERLRKPFCLYTFCGEDHRIAEAPMSEKFDEIMVFCYKWILHDSNKQMYSIIPGDHDCDYPANEECFD
ncbi:carboxylesterase family protein [uncultured Draconibacterium sp.]|uniref:alpha/beta hydrolase n=1 Tax=uncultured Draconibacterium sp. TaxID=1573823 RepID=UPI002AA7BE68|nr:carboxylesterase family protein [uncultured Draconibacterium sp.]